MGLRRVGKQGGTVQNEKRPGQGPGVLSRHRNALLAMTASFAVLAGFSSSAEAFLFDFPWNASSQPSVSRRSAPVRHVKPAPVATQPRENPATATRASSSGNDKAAAKENVVRLKELCPSGCEELADLEKALGGASAKVN